MSFFFGVVSLQGMGYHGFKKEIISHQKSQEIVGYREWKWKGWLKLGRIEKRDDERDSRWQNMAIDISFKSLKIFVILQAKNVFILFIIFILNYTDYNA